MHNRDVTQKHLLLLWPVLVLPVLPLLLLLLLFLLLLPLLLLLLVVAAVWLSLLLLAR